ncbi:MAG: PAS domain S-box protein [Defluviicoccus sp.]|nr:PAS domain S-box protein [Defluviicoccus sp.]
MHAPSHGGHIIGLNTAPDKHPGGWQWALPHIVLGLFLVALFALFWVLQRHEQDVQRSTLQRDIRWAEQSIRQRLLDDQVFLGQLARALAEGNLPFAEFRARAGEYVALNPELIHVVWVDADQVVRWVAPFETTMWNNGERLSQVEQTLVFQRAHELEGPAYGEPTSAAGGASLFEVHVPVRRNRTSVGTMVGVYAASGLVQYRMPAWLLEKYSLALEFGNKTLGGGPEGGPQPGMSEVVELVPPGNGVRLRVGAFAAESGLARNLLMALVTGLAMLVVWSFWSLRNRILERRRAEEALRAESAFRKAMEESLVTGLRAIDLDGRIIYANSAFCRMLGLSPEQLVGQRPPFPYWPPEEHDRLAHNLNRTLAGEVPANGFEVRIMRANGERFDARFYVSPLIDANGRQTGWMASINDITEPLRARAELQAAHERFVTVLDELHSAVHVADAHSGGILYANRAFLTLFGADAVGRDCWQVTACCHPGAQALLHDPRTLSAADVPCELFDGEVHNGDNERWYRVHDRAIKWVDGRVVRMVIGTDITEHKQIQDMTQRQQERLEQTARLISMGEMASSLAHELNQPLSAIANYSMGCVNRLRSGSYNAEDLLAAMQKASFQAERAGKIIRRMRDFVRKSEPHRAQVVLAEIVDEALGFAEIEARKAGTEIRVDIAPDLPPVHADKIMIEQVLLNLVKNGIEAMATTPRDRRRLTVSAHRNGGQHVEVEVSDRGHGITGEQADKLFSPFYTTKPQGMGMGLNICRSIVEYHHGRMWALPNPGGGSIFRFTLPLQE